MRNRTWKVVGCAAGLAVLLAGCRRGEEPLSTAEQKQPMEARPSETTGLPAGRASAPEAPEQAAPETGLPLAGEVEAIEGERLVVRGRGDERHVLTLGEETRFVGPDGQQVSREAIHEGTFVHAQFSQRGGGDLLAVEVRVAPAPPPPREAPPR